MSVNTNHQVFFETLCQCHKISRSTVDVIFNISFESSNQSQVRRLLRHKRFFFLILESNCCSLVYSIYHAEKNIFSIVSCNISPYSMILYVIIHGYVSKHSGPKAHACHLLIPCLPYIFFS